MSVTPNGFNDVQLFNGAGTSNTSTYSPGGTLQSNAMLVIAIGFTCPSSTLLAVSSLTDSNGNTWQRYHEEHGNSGWNTGSTVNGQQRGYVLELWYCTAATCGTTIDITINFTGTVDACVACLYPKFLGYDPTHPFDLNASLPKALRVNASAASTITGISTDTAHVYPCWAEGIWGTNLSLSNVQFDGVTRTDQTSAQKNNSEFTKTQIAHGPAVTSAYSGVTFQSPTSPDNALHIAFAITSDAQAGPSVNHQPVIVIMQ